MATSKFTETYTSFGGADIVALFNGHTIGTLSGITWSIQREKAPIFTLGSANPRSFSRGKRGIAGTLIFQVFDRDVLYNLVQNDPDAWYYTRVSNHLNGMVPGTVPWEEQSINVQRFKPYYPDQVPPFDITITYANEYGRMAKQEIFGVEILNASSGVSMDDIQIDEAMTFVARELGHLSPDSSWNIVT
jgi:hypothetical protein